MSGKRNPRQSNGGARRKAAKQYAATNAPCALCGGAIRYDQPRSHMFPLSLAIDEIRPVSRWREFGYASADACATDPNNWQPTHYACNARASDKKKKTKVVKRDVNSGTF